LNRFCFLLLLITGVSYSQNFSQVDLFLDQEKAYQALFHLHALRGQPEHKQPSSSFAINNRLLEAHFINQSPKDSLSRLVFENQRLLAQVKSVSEREYFYYVKNLAQSQQDISVAIDFFTNTSFSEPRIAGNAWLRLGDWLDLSRQHEKSLAALQKALQEFRSDSSRFYYKIYRAHYLMGIAFKNVLQYPQAEREYILALKILEATPEPLWLEKSRCQNNLANVYNETNRYKAAREYYEKSLQIKRQYLQDSASVATTYANIASFYTRFGNFSQARTSFDQTLLYLPAPRTGRDFIRKNTIISNQCGLLRELGEFSMAQHQVNAALLQSESRLPEDDPSRLRLKLRLAENAISLDKVGEAGRMLQQVQAQAQPGTRFFTEYSLTLTNFLFETELYDSCLHVCRTLLKEADVSLQADDRYYVLIKIANCLEKSVPDQSIDYYKQAYHLASVNEQPQKVIESLDWLATIFLSIDQLDSARQYYNQSLRLNLISTPAAGTNLAFIDDNLAMSGYHRLAALEFRNQHQLPALENAMKHIQVALQLVKEKRERLQFESDQLEFLDFVEQVFQLAVDIHYAAYQKNLIPWPQVFEVVEQHKSQVLLGNLKRQGIEHFAGVTQAINRQEEKLRQQQHHLYYDLAYQLMNTEPDPDLYQEKKLELTALNRSKDSFLDSLQRHLPGYYQLKYDQTLVLPEELARAIPRSTLVIEFVRGAETIYALGLSRSATFFLTIGNAKKFDKEITLLANQMALKEEKVLLTARHLYQPLFGSIDSLIRKNRWPVTELVIIPEGKFNLVPFEVLQDERNRFLLEKYTIHYNYSASLYWQKLTDPPRTKSEGLAGFAPQFGSSQPNHALLREEWIENFQFTELPETKNEVAYLAQVFQKHRQGRVAVFDTGANEATFKALPFEQFSLVHLATHGFAGLQGPGHSGIAFSRNSPAEDDILFAEEVYDLKMPLELVTLSACETGLGKNYSGEGLVGLTRGFFYAGARSVLVTLWKVQDNSTAELMKGFYKNYLGKGRSKAQALRQAKLTMLRSDTWNHPFYWSAFILLGAN